MWSVQWMHQLCINYVKSQAGEESWSLENELEKLTSAEQNNMLFSSTFFVY